jgi:BlaI family penicillinase repressor
MSKLPLANNEWKIMNLLWRQSPQTMRNLHDALFEETGWSKFTIISFLKRMIAKGAIVVDETESVKRYSPLLNEKQTVRQETRNMLNKLYDGSLSLMLTNLVEQNELSDAEISELMEILKHGKEV